MPTDTDALIIGGGPAGSAAAIWLARAGWRVTVVERARFPRDKPCAEYMSPETVHWLDRLGLGDWLERAGGVATEGTVVVGPRGGRLVGRFGPALPAPFGPTGLSISRRELDLALLRAAAAAGATVLEATAATDILCLNGAVNGARLRGVDQGEQVVTARLTIGADGLRSLVARSMGGRRFGRPRRMAFVAHMAGVTHVRQHAELHVARHGYAGLNPIGRDRVNVALVVPRSTVRDARRRLPDFFRERLNRFPGLQGRLSEAEITRDILVTGPFSAWSGRTITHGALLVGDAADFFDPFTGDGIGSALRGSWLAAQVAGSALTRPGPVSRAALKPYARRRVQQFAGKWALERLIGYGMTFPELFDRAVTKIGNRPPMADLMIGVTGHCLPFRLVLNPWYLTRMMV